MWLRQFLVWARPLFVAVGIYLAVAVVYLQVVPPLEGFDSIPHQNYVNYLRSTGDLPRIEPEAAIFSYQLVQHPPLYYLVAAALTLPWDYAEWDTHVRAQENVYFGTLSNRWSLDLPNPPPGLVASQWIARLLSLLGGALAVVGAWLWTRTVLYRVGANLPEDDTGGMGGFGLAVVMLFALNPLFLFISTTVTNDSWAIMGAVWVMWLTTVLARHPQSSLWRWVALGLVAGAAALIKYNVLVLIFPVAAALVFAYRHAWRRLALGTGVAVVSALAVAGYWYFRNLYLYGELIPWTRLGEVISTIEREDALPWGELLRNLDWLFYSYWGVFVSIFAPEPFFAFWKWFCLICALGLVVALGRASTTAWRMRVGPALIWLVGVVIATIYWARTISFGEQARLALIAGPALALLLSLGWRALVPKRPVPPQAYGLVAVFVAV
ncbi:MAG: glycosyltransferase family 39 protein, partial [Litorilinea sp.]